MSEVRHESISSFRLPFDEKKPVLVCGPAASGKTALLRHLIATEPTRRPVAVIDAAAQPYGVPGKAIRALSPTGFETDADFYTAATQAIVDALMHGGLLVVDGLDVLAAPYRDPMPAQETFLDTLNTALRGLRGAGGRVLIASATPPDAEIRDQCGARIWLGDPDPQTWPLLFGPRPAPSRDLPFDGTFGLDGQVYPLTFPYTEPSAHDVADDPSSLVEPSRGIRRRRLRLLT